MSYGVCPHATESCKYFKAEPVIDGEENGCHTNEHHIYRQADAKQLGQTAVRFANLARNRIQLCARLHQDLEARFGWPELPARPVMEAYIEADNGR